MYYLLDVLQLPIRFGGEKFLQVSDSHSSRASQMLLEMQLAEKVSYIE